MFSRIIPQGIGLSLLAAGWIMQIGPSIHPVNTASARLRLVEVGSDSTSFDVTATLVVGPTEVLLWDAMYLAKDAERLADTISASGKRLKAIVISHPDEDHVSGLAVVLRRFPGTPVYMTSAARKHFIANAPARFAADKGRMGNAIADSLVTPSELPWAKLSVDGQEVRVIPDLSGDMGAPLNSVLWIPSLRAILAGDVTFNHVYPWLGVSDAAARVAWRSSLKRLAALDPRIVVSGHKKSVALPDSPQVLKDMDAYLKAFDAGVATAATPMELAGKLTARYPDWAVVMLLRGSIMRAMGSRASAVGGGGAPAPATGAAPSNSAAPIALGAWTGSFTPPGAPGFPATFEFARNDAGLTLVISMTGRETVRAENVAATADNLTFVFQPGPRLNCTLKKDAAGSYSGTCSDGALMGAIELHPPK